MCTLPGLRGCKAFDEGSHEHQQQHQGWLAQQRSNSGEHFELCDKACLCSSTTEKQCGNSGEHFELGGKAARARNDSHEHFELGARTSQVHSKGICAAESQGVQHVKIDFEHGNTDGGFSQL